MPYKDPLKRKEYHRQYTLTHPDTRDRTIRGTGDYRRYEQNNKKRLSLKNRKRSLRLFNMTLEEYDSLLLAQNNGCAICGKSPEANGRRLCVDHDHKCCPYKDKSCGKCIRGLLCHDCNVALGGFKDNVDLLRFAAQYVMTRIEVDRT